MKYTVWAILCVLLMACNSESNTEKQPTESNTELVESVEYYDNGLVKMRGKKKGDKREGKWESFYPTGYKWSETTFRNGVKEGPTTTYYPDGIMRYSGTYYEDQRSGMWFFYDSLGMVMEKINMEQRTQKGDSLVNAGR